ncbi:MAG: IgGFc-binding protein, partial [Myxococcota bacterium]|nr:IgGFc-binding protein [Myxococcota bacterium]
SVEDATSSADGQGADAETSDADTAADVAAPDVEIPLTIDESTCEGAAAAFTSAGCLFAPIIGNDSSTVAAGPLPWAVIAANANDAATDVTLYQPAVSCTSDADCAPCGDGVCNGGETSVNCLADCGPECGDDVCSGAETSTTCETDCNDGCGNGACTGKETSVTCPVDCEAICGDHACTGAETPADCPGDCGAAGDSCTDGTCPYRVVDSVVIEGGGLHVFELAGVINAQWEHEEESGVFERVLRLEATRPIVAYQFQPYSSSHSATADAALLLPRHAWGNNYLVLNQKGSGPTWVTIVALDDDVEARIRLPDVMNASTKAGGPIPALSAGQVHLLPLDAGESARIYASSSVDLSGMGIYSGNKDVAVFVGSPGTSLPGPSFVGYNDYLEEQVPPRTAWGTDVAVVKFRPITNEEDVYRVMADKNGTTVTVTGDVEAQYSLDEGEFVQFESDGAFHVSGSDAILVAHGMVSCKQSSGIPDASDWPGWFEATNNCGTSGTLTAEDMGDPAVSFLTPSAQYRNEYVFLTPYTYAWDMLTIIVPDWAWESVLLDGLPLPAPTPLPGDEDLAYARFLIADGPHHVESPMTGVGIEVYGYDCRLSYAYAGGLSLGAINEPPPPEP